MGKDKSIGTPAPVKKIGRWVRSRSVRVKVTLGVVTALVLLILMKLVVKKQEYFFLAAQTAHAVSIMILVYKLTISKTCAGLSLKSQQLTAIHLALNILVSVQIRFGTYMIIDALALAATLWVIYMMRTKLTSTYMKELDTMPLYYVLAPAAVVAFIMFPRGNVSSLLRWLWAFSVQVEAVAVLPQLRLMQNAKVVEAFTAHYVFAIGLERFFGCGNWILQVISSKGAHLLLIGQGQLWILLAYICEVVQTFILADFCYYYVKSVMEGQSVMNLPSYV